MSEPCTFNDWLRGLSEEEFLAVMGSALHVEGDVSSLVRYEGEDIEALERSAMHSVSPENQRVATGGRREQLGTMMKRHKAEMDEIRVTSATGGQKGSKAVQMARLPQAALRAVAEHFEWGQNKYPDVAPGVANWSLGYAWSLGINALHRHLSAWEAGEDVDPEFGTSHLRAVAFHALTLLEFEIQGWGTDDRYTPERRDEEVRRRQ